MRVFYYNLDDAAFVDESGEQLSWVAPDLYYQENPDWCFMLKRGENTVADLSGVVAWGAAVDCDFSTVSTPMCRTLSDGITADVETGAVTVALDCSTSEFLAAVDGNPSRRAWFELYGLDANGRRILYLCIEIKARMIVDPDPEVSPSTPDTLATKAFVSAYVQQSGAIMENRPFTTTVGGYTVALTSGGGLAVSGSGASVVLSGGAIAAGVEGGEEGFEKGVTLAVTSLGAVVSSYDNVQGNFLSATLAASGVFVDGSKVATEPWADSRFAMKQLVTSTYAGISGTIGVLSGGTSFVFTSALYSLEVDSVVKTTEASYIHFTLDSVTAPTPVVISGASWLNSATFEGGKEYLVGFFDGMCVANEVTQ